MFWFLSGAGTVLLHEIFAAQNLEIKAILE
jgi:hypothetical protein